MIIMCKLETLERHLLTSKLDYVLAQVYSDSVIDKEPVSVFLEALRLQDLSYDVLKKSLLDLESYKIRKKTT